MLSNFDIIDICHVLNIPLKEVCCKDELPKKPTEGAYIINMANSNEKGTHWVSFILKNKNLIYFDSFGIAPPQEVYKFPKKNTNIIWSKKEIQNINSECCGYYCIAFLYYILNIGTGYEFLNMFKDDPTKNSNILLKFMSKIMKTKNGKK